MQLAVVQQLGHPALVDEFLARDGGVVAELFCHHVTEKFMGWQMLGQVFAVGQFFHLAHAMHQNYALKFFISSRVAHNAHERGEPSAGRQQVQAFSGQQIVNQQRAGRFAAHNDGVTDLDVLELGCERSVWHLDAQKFEVFFVVGAGDAVGAQQRLGISLQANHGEVAIAEAQGRVARGGEAEQFVCPVVHAKHACLVECAHLSVKAE